LVAISNHRIVRVTESEVSFSYKDYRDSARKKTMTLTHAEFTRRFAQHILPHRFVRIRHYGIVSATWKRGKLQTLQTQLKIKRLQLKVKTLLKKCPCCKTGTLVTIDVFGKRGPPKKYLPVRQAGLLEKQMVPVV
jgi:hypothetical protein